MLIGRVSGLICQVSLRRIPCIYSRLRQESKGSIAQKQPVQTLYGLSNQIVPRACFPDGIRVSNRPGYNLIDKPVQNLYGLVLAIAATFDSCCNRLY